MNKVKNGDLKISGSGSAAGGVFEDVDISGSGKINGNIDCHKFRTSGSSKVNGDISTNAFKVSGSSHIYGNVDSEDIHVSGNVHIDGHVGAKTVSISGSAHIERHLAAEFIEIKGGVTIDESCSTEVFNMNGKFKIGGLLNADTVDVHLYHRSSVKEIGGETIKVRIGKTAFGLSKLFSPLVRTELTADLIEGDTIFLENTTAKVVRGNTVHIGAGCHIDLVEYKEKLTRSGDGTVRTEKKIL
ncbi:cytoskeletal protein CcmA (bactofilin family) [Pullulanibacillus pueri]|uniref:Polymer-forming cytoskeletal protein n=1 Tax=Pullulanibacillus pueri TaxID=1437324 RepID=A0A8J2ZSY3_9BACL|nr:polymer-forming cytoskeletal protein [Pullulanibacillus pueri]MBM7680352.1 cytoskeletal protein CcmA (bactofilin family) [Pullulanibacillus pueri]GGH75504.1 hypothetical protein GCM10007096_04800 [Pullulanibacillus pueri]